MEPALNDKSAPARARSDGPPAPKSKGKKDATSRDPASKGKFAEKYKYVRFVEKKKLLRKMRQLQQSLMSGETIDKAEIETKLAELRKDVLYIDKFPGNQKYISLFPAEGALSEECRKKQSEIRSMIVNLTKLNEEKAEKRKLDVIQRDDFFASIDNIEKEPVVAEPVVSASKSHRPSHHDSRPAKEPVVHPSCDAKKHNEKLTGSIASTKFEGSRVVFDD